MSAFHETAMGAAPFGGPNELASPQAQSGLLRSAFFRVKAAERNRPSFRDETAIEIGVARFACGEQTSVSVALPSLADDRPACDQHLKRCLRFAAAPIGLAISRAGLIELRRIDAAQTNALARKREGIAVVDDHRTSDLPDLHAVQSRGDEREQAEDEDG